MLKHRYSDTVSHLPEDSPLKALSRSPRKESKKPMNFQVFKD